MQFEIHLLDASFNRDQFNCGNEELNKFLRQLARQHQDKNISRTFVAIEAGDEKKRVLGFYSQSMAEIDLSSLPQDIQKKLPRHPIPAARIGRFATDVSIQGQGLGKHLLVDSLRRVKSISQSIGVFAVIVDAKDQKAKEFYLKFNFSGSAINPMELYYPVKSIP